MPLKNFPLALVLTRAAERDARPDGAGGTPAFPEVFDFHPRTCDSTSQLMLEMGCSGRSALSNGPTRPLARMSRAEEEGFVSDSAIKILWHNEPVGSATLLGLRFGGGGWR